MNILKPFFGTLALGTFLFGCGKNEAVVAAEAMATAVCACKDLGCAQKVSAEHAEKLMKFKDKMGTDADAKAITAAGEKTAECMKKIAADSIKVMEAPKTDAPATEAPAPATEAPAPATEAAAPGTEAAAPGTEAAAPGTEAAAPASDAAPASAAPATAGN